MKIWIFLKSKSAACIVLNIYQAFPILKTCKMDNLGTFPLIGANSRSGVLLLGPFLTQSEPILCCDFRLLSRGFLIQLSISVLRMVYHRFRFLEIRLLSGSTVFRISCARFGQDAIIPAVEPFEGVNSW